VYYINERRRGKSLLSIFFLYLPSSSLIKRNWLQLGCKETKKESFFSLVPAYCARIFQDLINFEAWDFPNVVRDLMLEQGIKVLML